MSYRIFLAFMIGSVTPLGSAVNALGASASAVASYEAGGDASLNYRTPASALGPPNALVDTTVLSPFNPPWQAKDIVIIGDGGQLTLQLDHPAYPTNGPEIGVFVNNGLIDADWPHGQNLATAGYFSNPPQAIVRVSGDGISWRQIGTAPVLFGNPTNYYTDLGSNPSYTSIPGTQTSDFGKPFAGSLADFNGRDWNSTLALLNGSGGGTWLDIGPAGLPPVNFIRFEVPSGVNYRMVVDAVSIATAALPEPTSALLILAATLVLLSRQLRARECPHRKEAS